MYFRPLALRSEEEHHSSDLSISWDWGNSGEVPQSGQVLLILERLVSGRHQSLSLCNAQAEQGDTVSVGPAALVAEVHLMRYPIWTVVAITLFLVLLWLVRSQQPPIIEKTTPSTESKVVTDYNLPNVISDIRPTLVDNRPNTSNTRTSVVSIIVAGDKAAAGFAVSPYVVCTCNHVVNNRDYVPVILSNNQRLRGTVIKRSWAGDLALVRIPVAMPFLKMAIEDSQQGDHISILGHPAGYRYSLCRGWVSATDRKINLPTGQELTNILQLDASIHQGMSGSPVLNDDNEIVGMIVGVRNDGSDSIGFAHSGDSIKAFLQGR